MTAVLCRIHQDRWDWRMRCGSNSPPLWRFPVHTHTHTHTHTHSLPVIQPVKHNFILEDVCQVWPRMFQPTKKKKTPQKPAVSCQMASGRKAARLHPGRLYKFGPALCSMKLILLENFLPDLYGGSEQICATFTQQHLISLPSKRYIDSLKGNTK